MDQLSIYLPGLLLAYTACFLGLMSPGPNVLAVIGTAMGEGRKPGLALGFGVAAGSFCWATLTVAGLTTLITAYAWLLGAIKIAGGLYLLWLGFKAPNGAMEGIKQFHEFLDKQNSGGSGYYGDR